MAQMVHFILHAFHHDFQKRRDLRGSQHWHSHCGRPETRWGWGRGGAWTEQNAQTAKREAGRQADPGPGRLQQEAAWSLSAFSLSIV